MKIFIGEQPKNPCEGCVKRATPYSDINKICGNPVSCREYIQYQGQLSVLNQCKTVDFSKFLLFAEKQKSYIRYTATTVRLIEQFIQSEIKKQECKDGN